MRDRLPLWILGLCIAVLCLAAAQTAWATLYGLNVYLPSSDPSLDMLSWHGKVGQNDTWHDGALEGADWFLDADPGSSWNLGESWPGSGMWEWQLQDPSAGLALTLDPDNWIQGTGALNLAISCDQDGTIREEGHQLYLADMEFGTITGGKYLTETVLGGSWWTMSSTMLTTPDQVENGPPEGPSAFDAYGGGGMLLLNIETSEASAVPEPCSALLLLIAGGGLLACRRRRR